MAYEWLPKSRKGGGIYFKYPISFYYNQFSQKSALKKILWPKFLPNFQNVENKVFGKASSFQKNILKNITLGLKGPKMIKNFKLYPNFSFKKNRYILDPLTQPNIFFNIYFENYLIFQRFWYKKSENWVKTKVTVFFFFFAKLYSCSRNY